MRFLFEVTVPTERANAMMKSGTFGDTLGGILGQIRPEAAYFTEVDGYRTAFLVVDLQDAALLPAVAEPLFQAFQARVRFHPVMSAEDLQQAVPAIAQAAQRYG